MRCEIQKVHISFVVAVALFSLVEAPYHHPAIILVQPEIVSINS